MDLTVNNSILPIVSELYVLIIKISTLRFIKSYINFFEIGWDYFFFGHKVPISFYNMK